MNGLFRLTHRKWRIVAYLLCCGQRGFHQIFRRLKHLIDNAPVIALRRCKCTGSHDEFFCTPLARSTSQRLRTTTTGHDPQLGFRQCETCVAAGIDEIAGQRCFKTTAIRVTINGSNDRNRALQQCQERALKQLMLRLPLGIGHAVALPQVTARTKRTLTGTG